MLATQYEERQALVREVAEWKAAGLVLGKVAQAWRDRCERLAAAAGIDALALVAELVAEGERG